MISYLNARVDDLFSVKAYRRFWQKGIVTISDVIQQSDSALIKLLGRKCYYEVMGEIEKHGLKLLPQQETVLIVPVRTKAKVLVEREFWFCGIKGDGHYHTTEKGATNCLSARKKVTIQNKSVREARLHSALAAKRGGKTLKQIAEILGVGTSRALEIVNQAIRIEQQQEAFKKVSLSGFTYETLPMTCVLEAFSCRTYNCLMNMGAEKLTVGDLSAISDRELLAVQNFGRKSINELRSRLEELREKMGHQE